MVEPPGTATSVPQWRQEPRQERRSPILKENVPDAKICSKSSNLEKWRQTGLRLARARGLPTSMAGERRPLSTLQPFLFHPFLGLVLVVWQACLHLASPGLPHWASNGGPLVSGIDCRYTGCPAAIPIINTRTRMPAHIGKRYLNFPPPILCQRRTHPNLSDTKYNPSIKVSSCR